MHSFSGLALAFLVCVGGIFLLRKANLGKYLLDLPNGRSLHAAPIPRTGGTAIALSLAVNTVLVVALNDHFPFSLLASLGAYFVLVIVSLLDDIRSLSVRARLPLHLIVAAIWITVTFQGHPKFDDLPFWVEIGLGFTAMLGVGWAMNLYNFMDGSDGLAGSMAVTGFGAYAVASALAQDHALSFLCLSIVGASLGFLCFNWPKATIFLGDSGSIPLGFLAAAIGIYGVLRNYWSIEFPMIVFAMFWVDATYTLLNRTRKGEKIWLSHRQHWYQKAILSGNSHLKILLIHAACNICAAALALIQVLHPDGIKLVSRAITIGLLIFMLALYACWCLGQFSKDSKK
jgi:UDP-GlcNAc:undecaprenyl-phosphate/decaprenyl-phosphate GlcNAc-1-phosphate transferase